MCVITRLYSLPLVCIRQDVARGLKALAVPAALTLSMEYYVRTRR